MNKEDYISWNVYASSNKILEEKTVIPLEGKNSTSRLSTTQDFIT